MSDLDWLNDLEQDKTYSGIDVRREHGKMCNWCKVNRKQPTHRRFINWLNKADRPTENGAITTSSVYGKRYLPPVREVSDEERAKFLADLRREKAKLWEQFRR